MVAVLDPDLSLLGPVGVLIAARLGAGGTVAACALSLAVWTAAPFFAGLRIFSGERSATAL